MRFCLAAILLAGAGCFSTDKVWHGSLSFSESERAQIEQGAGFLSYMTGASVVILWDDEVDANRAIVKEPLGPERIGLTTTFDGGRQKISIEPRVSPNQISATAAHEFGHAIGIDHIGDNDRGLMNPVVADDLEWSFADDSACKRSGWCM